MDRWEHCIILSEQAGGGRNRVIYFLGGTQQKSFRREVIADKVKVSDYGDTLIRFDAPVIARLGNEGWELVHINDDRNWMFFKRRVNS